jgi:hypothetical protein
MKRFEDLYEVAFAIMNDPLTYTEAVNFLSPFWVHIYKDYTVRHSLRCDPDGRQLFSILVSVSGVMRNIEECSRTIGELAEQLALSQAFLRIFKNLRGAILISYKFSTDAMILQRLTGIRAVAIDFAAKSPVEWLERFAIPNEPFRYFVPILQDEEALERVFREAGLEVKCRRPPWRIELNLLNEPPAFEADRLLGL